MPTPHSTVTDDSVLCVAVADVLLHGGDFVDAFHDYFHRYPNAGFGGGFMRWAANRNRQPYYSWGNGSAMRVPPVGFAATSLEEALSLARRSAEVTHDHPEGIRVAQAVAAVIFLARQGADKASLRAEVEGRFARVSAKRDTGAADAGIARGGGSLRSQIPGILMPA
ncbi:ADP-ribosylglycohydrolase family protein [Billgrantia sp. Q4P2]|uniref:ADP-ribosylglycohydrolase family protein n=1 Tax=Billgrantia sp. Q4P2 TaxID=3463857 RepID=UPI004055AE28